MTSKLVPAHPEAVMSIRHITPNLVTLSVPFLRFGRLRIGGRATIMKLPSGALAVFSPVALTPAVQDTIKGLGSNVQYLIAPDIEHHIFISSWKAAFPAASIIGPEGLPEKRASDAEIQKELKGKPDVAFTTIYTKSNKHDIKVSPEFDAEFDVEFVDAHESKEIVLFFKREKTILEADLMFNLPATEQYSKTGEPANKGLLTKLFAGIQNTNGTAIWQKRMLWYVFSKGDREGFNKSIQRIGGWDFDRIVPCHGDVIEGNGKGIFQKVFEWHLQGKK